jgi:V/A-type H+-transporting ATPase subunit I
MASTVNLIAVLMGNMIPVVGLLVGAAILLGGHVITLVMNLLGAFVHPSRLQFVEFFTKFFKGGGRDFKPLRIENRFTEVK